MEAWKYVVMVVGAVAFVFGLGFGLQQLALRKAPAAGAIAYNTPYHFKEGTQSCARLGLAKAAGGGGFLVWRGDLGGVASIYTTFRVMPNKWYMRREVHYGDAAYLEGLDVATQKWLPIGKRARPENIAQLGTVPRRERYVFTVQPRGTETGVAKGAMRLGVDLFGLVKHEGAACTQEGVYKIGEAGGPNFGYGATASSGAGDLLNPIQ